MCGFAVGPRSRVPPFFWLTWCTSASPGRCFSCSITERTICTPNREPDRKIQGLGIMHSMLRYESKDRSRAARSQFACPCSNKQNAFDTTRAGSSRGRAFAPRISAKAALHSLLITCSGNARALQPGYARSVSQSRRRSLHYGESGSSCRAYLAFGGVGVSNHEEHELASGHLALP